MENFLTVEKLPFWVILSNRLTAMQRYHVPILALSLVSSFVLYLVVTQRAPFASGAGNELVLDTTAVIYFLTALFLTLASWLSILGYAIQRIFRPSGIKRNQTRLALKISLLVSIGITATSALRITQTLNVLTAALLWATLTAIVWTTKANDES